LLIPVAALVLAFLLGSVPVSYLIARFVGRVDLAETGSGNVGAANVYRALGLRWAFLAFLGDALKGLAPALVAALVLKAQPRADWWIAGAGLCAVLGHLFPPWLGFRGGKGVATSFGVMLALAPTAAGIAFAVWAAALAVSKIMSLSSLAGALALPVLTWFFSDEPAFRLLALALAAIVFISHHENLRRLLRGEEKPLARKKEAAPL